MDDSFKITYDQSKDFEAIFDFHGNTQIIRVNSQDTNKFLETGYYFDTECLKRVDKDGIIRIVYVVDQIPPLSAILKFISNPVYDVNWGIYAVIVPPDLPTLSKITPIIQYGLGITRLKGKFTLRVFDYSHRDNMQEVIAWMDENMKIKSPKIDVRDMDKIHEEAAKVSDV